ncbi:hypothetical protein LNO88_12160 [Klebsiella pneumoniae subsp. pneumoniae]|nr:hypothetical protein [Klebsiella pneumoniae subsp. pneumoniae]
MAAQLKGPLTVITASLDIAQLFSDRADIQLIPLGGQWDSKQRLLPAAPPCRWSPATGPISPFSAPARSMPGWRSASREADADVKRAMLTASAEHWLVADHTKLNRCEPRRWPGSATFTIFS